MFVRLSKGRITLMPGPLRHRGLHGIDLPRRIVYGVPFVGYIVYELTRGVDPRSLSVQRCQIN